MLTESDIIKIAALIGGEIGRCKDNAAAARTDLGANFAKANQRDAEMLCARFKATFDIGWED